MRKKEAAPTPSVLHGRGRDARGRLPIKSHRYTRHAVRAGGGARRGGPKGDDRTVAGPWRVLLPVVSRERRVANPHSGKHPWPGGGDASVSEPTGATSTHLFCPRCKKPTPTSGKGAACVSGLPSAETRQAGGVLFGYAGNAAKARNLRVATRVCRHSCERDRLSGQRSRDPRGRGRKVVMNVNSRTPALDSVQQLAGVQQGRYAGHTCPPQVLE